MCNRRGGHTKEGGVRDEGEKERGEKRGVPVRAK